MHVKRHPGLSNTAREIPDISAARIFTPLVITAKRTGTGTHIFKRASEVTNALRVAVSAYHTDSNGCWDINTSSIGSRNTDLVQVRLC
jgi:hypothetical protein